MIKVISRIVLHFTQKTGEHLIFYFKSAKDPKTTSRPEVLLLFFDYRNGKTEHSPFSSLQIHIWISE